MDDESDEELPVLATPGFSEALGGVGAVTVGAGGAAGLTPAEGGFGFGGGFALNKGKKGISMYPDDVVSKIIVRGVTKQN